MSTELDNKVIQSVMGRPMLLPSMEVTAGQPQLIEATIKDILQQFVSARNPQTGQNLVIGSFDDSRRAGDILRSLTNVNGSIHITDGDFAWLKTKFREFGHLVFPLDAAHLYDRYFNDQVVLPSSNPS